jgi:hypothetical protein
MSPSDSLAAAPAPNQSAENGLEATPARQREAFSVRVIWLAVVFLVVVTWVVGRSGLYTPGSNAGYYLGLAGALMMLSLLLYPVRKYIRSFRTVGDIRRWFQVHMFFGIAGPVLILLHSTYHIGSYNAAVAFYTMLIVAGSGILGRFMYTKIHRGLYGRRTSLEELQARLFVSEGEVKSRFRFAPQVEARLRGFTERALAGKAGMLPSVWHFSTLRIRSWGVRLACGDEIREMLGRHATESGWPRKKFARRRRLAMVQVESYLGIVVDVTQFHTYERMFSLWHVLHVPLVYGLVLTSVIHVVAVHMY